MSKSYRVETRESWLALTRDRERDDVLGVFRRGRQGHGRTVVTATLK